MADEMATSTLPGMDAEKQAFTDFLQKANLLMFKEKFIDEGVERIEDVQDIKEDALQGFGMSQTQMVRMQRIYKQELETALKAQSRSSPPAPKPKPQVFEGKVNVFVPFESFTNSTGGDIIRVPKQTLQRRYANLWYANPNCLKQQLNNSFILEMSLDREPTFPNLRKMEDWARKERERRLSILMCIHPCDTKLAQELKYIKKKCVNWALAQLKTKYPVVSNLKEDDAFSTKTGYSVLLYHAEIREIEKSLEKILKDAEKGLDEVKNKASFKEQRQWYTEVLPKIRKLDEEVKSDVDRINKLKMAAEANCSAAMQSAENIAKRKRNKGVAKEKRGKAKRSKGEVVHEGIQKSRQSLINAPCLQKDDTGVSCHKYAKTSSQAGISSDIETISVDHDSANEEQMFQEEWNIFDNSSDDNNDSDGSLMDEHIVDLPIALNVAVQEEEEEEYI